VVKKDHKNTIIILKKKLSDIINNENKNKEWKKILL